MLDGDPALLPKKGAEPPPKFSAHFYCGQTAGCIKMPLDMEVGLSLVDFVLVGDPAPSQNGSVAPRFSAQVKSGQTAEWIKMAFGIEVGLSTGDFVLVGDPAPPPQKGDGAPSSILG